jgi:hypothetical protein
MAFMRDLFYWHDAAQPRHRTRTVKGKRVQVTEPPVGPDALAAILNTGAVVVIEMTDPEWYTKGNAIPFGDIIGTAFRSRDKRTWSGHYTGPHGNNQTVKDSVGRTEMPSAEDVGRAALACVLAANNAELAVLADPVAHLDRELKSHDWYCHMSDAPGVCGAGERHMRQIMEIVKDVPADKVRELWAQHAPHAFACPV